MLPQLPDSLAALAELDVDGQGVALTRLAKRLDQRVSLLMREYTLLGELSIGGVAGPGWVRLECAADSGRWTAHLTESGRAHCKAAMNENDDLPAALRLLPVLRVSPMNTAESRQDQVAVEMPVALVFNGISHAVMMATPADLEAFALGFALSEGLLLSREECFGIEVQTGTDGCEVHLQVAAAAEMRLKEQRRSLVGRTGCGLCGIDSLRRLDLAPPPLAAAPAPIEAAPLLRAFAQLPAMQPLNTQTGAHHAAAWVSPEGQVLRVMEDVGRHNALDKLLGQRLLDQQRCDDGSGFVIMSSRASYELVLKCARLGVPALATISAPTSLAVDIATRAGMLGRLTLRTGRTLLFTDLLESAHISEISGTTGCALRDKEVLQADHIHLNPFDRDADPPCVSLLEVVNARDALQEINALRRKTQKHEFISFGGRQAVDDARGRAKCTQRTNHSFTVDRIVPDPNIEVLCGSRVAMQTHSMPADNQILGLRFVESFQEIEEIRQLTKRRRRTGIRHSGSVPNRITPTGHSPRGRNPASTSCPERRNTKRNRSSGAIEAASSTSASAISSKLRNLAEYQSLLRRLAAALCCEPGRFPRDESFTSCIIAHLLFAERLAARASNQGRAPWLPRAGRYSAATRSFGDGLFLAKLELRLRKDVELQREAPVLVLEGDPRAVPVALAACRWCWMT